MGQFNGNERFLDHHVFDKYFVELGCFFRQQAHFNGDTGLAQDSRSLTGDAGIGVEHGHDDLADALFGQRPRARRCSAVMGARFEGHINRRSLGLFPGLSQRPHFGMRGAGLMVIAGADDFTIFDDDAADGRIWCRITQS